MFGKYELNEEIREEDIEIKIGGRGKIKRYYRKAGNEEIEKIVSAESGNLYVVPVEPVNLPKLGVAEHLMIELEKPYIIEPYIEDTFYLKFPIEIGVFLVDKRDVERIDIFTMAKQKYILYGSPEQGIICRWWKSNIYNDKPEVNKTQEGIIRIDIKNSYREWVEVKKLVFRAFDMKIFYNDYAYMHAHINLLKKTMAETAFNSRKPKNMNASIDIYEAKGIKKFEKKFVMEWGL
ncbi:MAG: DUF432 domain-containing protein [Thermoplasmata archaeon]|nr:MAG: DUF432 domain-containing protein [Thermoplasmata archaeon]